VGQSLDDVELLEQNPRPTFVLDLQVSAEILPKTIEIEYCNKSLRIVDILRDLFSDLSLMLSQNITIQSSRMNGG
jgi:hypothetical protein